MSKKISNYLLLTNLSDHIVIDRDVLIANGWNDNDLKDSGQLYVVIVKRTTQPNGAVTFKVCDKRFMFLPSKKGIGELSRIEHFDINAFLSLRSQELKLIAKKAEGSNTSYKTAKKLFDVCNDIITDTFNTLDALDLM